MHASAELRLGPRHPCVPQVLPSTPPHANFLAALAITCLRNLAQ
eukprot:CAMPEP_0204571408 /NCGR_PEP_ID=MMETSP0661-20131031/38872_1 /ASSEMBLY_ACC=CAM_ASM_000606 /TAXON_ID=109239 /ORGANISM="Alexandrium margalefi, Strain AMGDE01CS-322" /LENGTH=43 /DNA_ID= /DNA_START= /DNA_END= /DNA_ORIENTATION=